LEGRGRWISEFKASLVYRVSSRTARATQRNPVSKKKKKKKKVRQDYFEFKVCLDYIERLSENRAYTHKHNKLFTLLLSQVSQFTDRKEKSKQNSLT
jgi:hypothetical protein